MVSALVSDQLVQGSNAGLDCSQPLYFLDANSEREAQASGSECGARRGWGVRSGRTRKERLSTSLEKSAVIRLLPLLSPCR